SIKPSLPLIDPHLLTPHPKTHLPHQGPPLGGLFALHRDPLAAEVVGLHQWGRFSLVQYSA
ncbi:MAG: hypothetical protein IJM18_06380, partial [Clostridia bacterium]|nr:hypothetical protein [Clostridia bacterium]